MISLGQRHGYRVKCPRSSVCNPQFSCTRAIQQKLAISSLTAKLLSEKAQHRKLLAYFLCTISQLAQHFPHFSGVPLFLLLIKMPGHWPLPATVLYHTISYSTLFQCVLLFRQNLNLLFTWEPYLGYITSNVRRTRVETDCWEEQKAESQVSDGTVRKTLLKEPDRTVWFLSLKDAGLTTRMWEWSLSSRLEQEGKDLFTSPLNFCFSQFCIFVGLRVLLS